MEESVHCIGLMSGTSMDGVDLAHCTFTHNNGQWHFQMNAAECMPYPEVWQKRLVHLSEQNAEVFAKTNVYYGHFLGQCVQQFAENNQLTETTDLVSSHGQTVFHNPARGYTIQIGHGAAIAKECNLPVVCDLRTSDMAYRGQGAPIVPFGEQLLFPSHKQFVNIGGITNVSLHSENSVIGYDVCMGNLLLDAIAETMGQSFDRSGLLAQSGKVNQNLLSQLNDHDFFEKPPPKSLDAEEVINTFFPIVMASPLSNADRMATLVEHIAIQLAANLNKEFPVLLTGGGALNNYLVTRIEAHFENEIIVPEQQLIEFKEALIIALLGVLRLQKQPNVLSSVTGAEKNTINGAVYLP